MLYLALFFFFFIIIIILKKKTMQTLKLTTLASTSALQLTNLWYKVIKKYYIYL
jgi:hypothetical protein